MVITGRCPLAAMAIYYGILFLLILLWKQPVHPVTAFLLRIKHIKKTANKSSGKKRRQSDTDRKKIIIRRRQRVLTTVLTAILAAVLLIRPAPPVRVLFLDIGQGDTILVQTKHHAMLIDCGSSSLEKVWRYRISPCLKYYGIRRLDMVFLTHGDMDHMNGLKEMLGEYETNLAGQNAADITIGKIVCSREEIRCDSVLQEVCKLAEEKEIGTILLEEGDVIRPEPDITFTCLYPDAEDVRKSGGDLNQASMVMLLGTPKMKILLAGDLEKEGEVRLAEELALHVAESRTDDTAVRILKAGHHGSRYATSDALLSAFRPELAVISCGRNNRYGHPAQTMLKRLYDHNVSVLRTDRQGSVLLTEGKKSIRAETWLQIHNARDG